MNIYQKLIEVRKLVPYLQKGDAGAQYSYTGSSRVLAAVVDKMNEVGLLLIPSITGHNVSESPIEVKDANGNVTKRTTTYFTELEMTMTWVNAEKPDEQIVSSWYGQGVDIAGEKGVGKALTYAEKYFMLKFFNIATDKDDPDAFQAKHGLNEHPEQPHTPSEQPKETNWKEKNEVSKQQAQGVGEQRLSEELQRAVMGLMSKRGMKFPDLNELCTAVLERPVKFFKKDVVDVAELKKIKAVMDEAVGA